MTATVVSLAAHRRNQKPACGCPRHELGALTDRLRDLLAETEGHLLIPRDHLTTALDDVCATTLRLLPPSERTNDS